MTLVQAKKEFCLYRLVLGCSVFFQSFIIKNVSKCARGSQQTYIGVFGVKNIVR